MTSVYVVLSTPIVSAFLDIAPMARGHVLLIPRENHEKLSDLRPKQSAVLGFWLPILSRGVMAGLLGTNWESKGMSWNVVQANGLHLSWIRILAGAEETERKRYGCYAYGGFPTGNEDKEPREWKYLDVNQGSSTVSSTSGP